MNARQTMIAFDFGASSGRAMAGRFDGERMEIAECHRFENNPVQAGQHLHWDVLRLFHELKQGLTRSARDGVKPACIGVDTWGVDFGLLDEHGLLMGNPFHYRDELTEGILEQAFQTVPRQRLYAMTGIQFLRFNSLFQLLAIQRRYPSLLDRASRLLLMPDLFNYLLTGEQAAEFCIASTSQMLDWTTGGWHTELLSQWALPASILPAVAQPGAILGNLLPQITEETGVSTKVALVCSHDTASAVLATPMSPGENTAFLSCGTWSLLGAELDAPLINDRALAVNYTNEGGIGRSVRFLTNIMGLWLHQEIRREFERREGPAGYDVLDREILKAKPFASLIDPDAAAFMTPGRMCRKITEFCRRTGQTPPEDRGAFLRCVLESLALTYRRAIGDLEQTLGKTMDVIRIVGGGCKDSLLMQFTANATGKPVLAGPVEATALGNLCGQLMALGEAKDKWEARRIVQASFEPKLYEPQDMTVWDDAFARFAAYV